MTNLREETLEIIENTKHSLSQVDEYYIDIGRYKKQGYIYENMVEQIILSGKSSEELLSEKELNFEYDESLVYPSIDGWISFKDGSWLRRIYDYDVNYNYWEYNQCPKLSQYLKIS